MKKIVSYRQKLFELARIYKIDKVFSVGVKYTTYEIEIILLKSNVPIPSRRGYFSHKIINELINPLYSSLKENFKISIKPTKILKKFLERIMDKYFQIIINPVKVLKRFLERIMDKYFQIIINPVKVFKKFFDRINNYFTSLVSNIVSFYRTLTKAIVESLNSVHNFKVKESLINKLVSRGAYAFLLVIFISGGFYVKQIFNDLDSVKISLEIKSDKKKINNNSKQEKNVVKKLESNKPKTKELAKIKPEKKSYDPETDYTLNTQTVLNLFEDLEYDLDRVRSKKKVKPIYFTRLPKDLDEIKSVNEKKETFLQILLPLIVAENEKIIEDRKYLLKILKKNESEKSRKWLNKKYKSYKVKDKNINELIEKIDLIPTSIALAQAAKESGWGTSRFALEGNAIYGQWTWNGDGIEPLEKNKDQKHKILKFPLLRASVKAYITNLNTHRGYKSFRVKRASLRKQNKKLAGLELIHELENYAQTGKEYTKILEKIIKQNDLDELEAVTIDDFKENKELKL